MLGLFSFLLHLLIVFKPGPVVLDSIHSSQAAEVHHSSLQRIVWGCFCPLHYSFHTYTRTFCMFALKYMYSIHKVFTLKGGQL